MYTSTRAQLEPGRYAVGLLSKNELHLNPIHGILHVKPAFQYLDKADKNLKSDMKESGAGEPGKIDYLIHISSSAHSEFCFRIG